MTAHASDITSINLTYSVNTITGYQAIYSDQASATTNPISISAPNGQIIQSVDVFRDDVKVESIPEASGKTNWSGTQTYWGYERQVESRDNDSLQGYYAWYRYIPGGDKGVKWYADFPSGTKSCGSAPTESINGYSMPIYPGCFEVSLSLTASRNVAYTTSDNGTVIPSSVVSNSQIIATSKVNLFANINGPAGVSAGRSDYTTTSGTVTATSANNYTVTYSQDFDHEGHSKELGSPPNGAKVMVYYAAFTVDLVSETYKYPDHIEVTYSGGTSTPSPTPTPTPASVSGDFQITPSTINYRDSFKLHPLPFTIPSGCTYTDHYYKIERGGSFVYTAKVYNQTLDTSYNQSNYPSILAVGSHQISLMIEASCGSSGFIATKTLTINGPSINGPPDFKIGWVKPSNRKTPLQTAVVGDTLDMIYIEDPSVPTPSDPDGDLIYWDDFNFNSSDAWTQTIPGKSGVSHYTDGYHNIVMDTPGFHRVEASMHDQWGASTTRSTIIEVLPPNPIPVCSAPSEIKENRTISNGAINASSSHSPVGRLIDHTKDVWSNLQTSYANGTMSDITITVTLESVTDTAGLLSLESSDCHITVHPDKPPIAKLGVPSFSVRGNSTHIQNQSYSTDGDTIASASFKYKYDTDNNGFQNDAWQTLSGGNVSGVDFTPAQIGKYLFFVTSCEDFGRCSDNSTQAASEITLDVVNKDGPVVSFEVEGENAQPAIEPAVLYPASRILTSWSLFQTNTNSAINKGVGWTAGAANQLAAGLGRNTQSQEYYNFNYEQWGQTQYRQFITPAQDFGLGPNGQSPYRSFASFGTMDTQPLLIPGSTAGTWQPVAWGYGPPVFKTTDTHIYFGTGSVSSTGGYSFYAMNKSKIGRYSGTTEYCSGCMFPDYVHKYLDGSPYDFIIKGSDILNGNYGPPPTYKTAAFDSYDAFSRKDYTHAYGVSTRTPWQATVLGYHVAGNIVYAKIRYPAEYAYYSGGEQNNVSVNLVELRTFDATTGQFISSSILNGYSPFDSSLGNGQVYSDNYEMSAQSTFPPQNVGEDLVVVVGESYYNDLQVRQINRQGQIVKSVPLANATWTDPAINPTSSCRDNVQKSFRGADGEFYFVSQQQCSYTSSGTQVTVAAGAAIIKLNADLSFAWKTKLKGSQTTYVGSFSYALGDHADAIILMVDNPQRNQIQVRSYSMIYMGHQAFYESIDKTTGVVSDSDNPGWAYNNQPTINWDGGYSTGTQTIEGYNTVGNTVKNAAGQTVGTINGLGGLLSISAFYAGSTNAIFSSQYVGDGMLMALFSSQFAGYDQHNFVPWLAIGTPSTTPAVGYPTKLGQFVSDFSVTDVELQFTLNMASANANTNKAGFSFRMQDPRNRYAVETNGSVIYLTKYVNGAPTVLASANFPFLDNTDYTFAISMTGNKIDLRLNGVPYLSIQDSTWLSGTIGPFTDKSYTTFTNIIKKPITTPQTAWYAGFALWESGSASATVKYDNISYTDSENDPASGTYQWFYKHTPKFLNNQGLSVLDNQTFSGSQTVFDKVGVYDITLSAKDDPNPTFFYPSMLFELYRKSSNPFHSSIVVHRRPVILNFIATLQGDGTVIFTDNSYDPDRYDPSTSACSAPDVTNMNYCANRGVVSRQYSFVDPNGNFTLGKPSKPSLSGSYTVYLQVADEYGALSVPVSTTFTTATPVPASPPIATLTMPNGAFANPTMVGINPDITWNQTDPDGYALTHYQVQVFDSGGTLVVDSGIVDQNQLDGSQTWHVPINLTLGAKYQVKVRVKDVYNWSAWSNFGWMQINSAPIATMTVPNGTQASPTLFNSMRPTLKWNQMDLDPGTTFQYFQIQITNETNNVMILDSGQYYQGSTLNAGSWQVNQDLPTGQKLRVRVRVFDGFTWSNYSPQTWMYINRAPIADFDWSPKPVWEGDEVHSANASIDPDGDSLTYTWTIEGLSGGTKSFTTTNFTHKFFEPGDYKVTLAVTDGMVTTTAVKTITVLPLTIHSDVTYTDSWLIFHNQQGHRTQAAPKQFYSGEIFVVKSQSETAPVEEVLSWMDTVGLDGQSLYVSQKLEPDSGDPTLYKGELFDSKFQSFTEGLPKGAHTIHFQIRYRNGIVKTEDVPIEIIGNVQQSVGVHRVQ
ncbi:PKD domain-containing protein [Paenibacillus roseipurpureus]|uniref:PKD domain-containing protein n=1 Tax=Paenibacillus roseopurpureus TaxID=2918901 RepID=A0AA96RJC4_9BACL|nr:PKD domain-containing protein [Paenibacillus sp. MBLB1832]WNR43159.1 PKD domain-containing protein [Paenibacillus sp. MBLB1832]